MTLKPSQIQAILNAKQEDFRTFDRRSLSLLQQYRTALASLSHADPALENPANTHPGPEPQLSLDFDGQRGATVLESFEQTHRGIVPSQLKWESREHSLVWVKEKLTGVTTFAVDGSQIFAGKDLSIPVALVQIGWFENPHADTGHYEKDIAVDVMTPSDLKAGNSGDPVDRRVNFRRLEMEIDRLVAYIEAKADAVASGQPHLVFYDGSLAASFATRFDDQLTQGYVDCFLRLLRASQTHRVPLVGYVDTSYARDLTVMLERDFDLPEAAHIHDAQLVNPPMQWGDRTPILNSQRSGVLRQYGEQQDQLTFFYLKTNQTAYPARVELPRWVVDDGLAPSVIDWVRAEVIIGGGYPYAIETADQTAVLRSDDRQAFFRILQDWADAQHLNLRLSRKMVSKSRRRR